MSNAETPQNETSVLQRTIDYLTGRYENLHTRIGGDPTRGIEGLEDKVGKLEIFRDRWTPKLEGNGKATDAKIANGRGLAGGQR